MAQYRPFAIKTTSVIPSGCTSLVNILIGVDDQQYQGLGGYQWWAGPDESLGYVIAYFDSPFTHPNPLNLPCGIGFLRSDALTDSSFLQLVNYFVKKNGSNVTFTDTISAKAWCNSNGHWTSYGETPWQYGSSLNTTPSSGNFSYNLVTLPYQPPLAGNTIFPDFSASVGILNPNEFGLSKSIWWNKIDSNGIDRSSDFSTLIGQIVMITFTQGVNSAIYETNAINNPNPDHFNMQIMGNQYIDLVQASPTNFIEGELVTISYTIAV